MKFKDYQNFLWHLLSVLVFMWPEASEVCFGCWIRGKQAYSIPYQQKSKSCITYGSVGDNNNSDFKIDKQDIWKLNSHI